jgi:hypothetical protein
MSSLGWCLALAALLAQPQMPSPVGQAQSGPPPMISRTPGAAGEPAEPAMDKVRMAAVQASSEGRQERQIAPELAGLKSLLDRLPFDTFTRVAEEEREIPQGQETKIPITGDLSLAVTSKGRAETGEVELDARIEMMQNGAPVNALLTSGRAAPGKALVFRGLKRNGGELVVIMTLVQDNQGQDQSQQPQQDQPQDQQEQKQPPEQPEEPSQEGEPPPEQNEEQQQQQAQEDQQSEAQQDNTPKDMHEIEAILKSLEEMDRREQPKVRNQRDRVYVPQDWW